MRPPLCAEDDVPLSALQHYVYCPRQCALIHMERIWTENSSTAQGRALHDKAHSGVQEKRGPHKVTASLFLHSTALGLFGQADMVEFFLRNGIWFPYPVEYKNGNKKKHDADRIQLCAQALCLEEMLHVPVPEGALFYGKSRRREVVMFDTTLREKTAHTAQAVRELLQNSTLPPPLADERCTACSLSDDCMPDARRNAHHYVEQLRELT